MVGQKAYSEDGASWSNTLTITDIPPLVILEANTPGWFGSIFDFIVDPQNPTMPQGNINIIVDYFTFPGSSQDLPITIKYKYPILDGAPISHEQTLGNSRLGEVPMEVEYEPGDVIKIVNPLQIDPNDYTCKCTGADDPAACANAMATDQTSFQLTISDEPCSEEYDQGFWDGAATGDVNADGELNVVDIVYSVNMILNGE